MVTGLRIEPAPVEAAAHLAHLHSLCFAPLPETPWSAHAFRTILRPPTTRAWIARSGEDEMAGLLVGRVTDGEAEILTVCVAPAARRTGTGRALLDAFLSRLPAQTRTVLEVAVDNTAAISLYESAGFVLTGRRPDYYAGQSTKVDALIYARPPSAR